MNLSSTSFSIHCSFINFIITSMLISQQKDDLFFCPVNIIVKQYCHGFLFYSISYNPFISFMLIHKLSKYGELKPFLISLWTLFIHTLHFLKLSCNKVISALLYFLCPSPEQYRCFSEDLRFLLGNNNIYIQDASTS